MQPPAAPTPLDYAPRPPIYRRRLGRIGILILTLATTAAAWHWGPGIIKKTQELYWQRQCLNYNPPPDRIVYDFDPAGSSLLGNGDYISFSAHMGFNNTPLIPAAIYIPKCLTKYSQTKPIAGAFVGPTLFMHELRAPSGNQYLVILQGYFGSDVPPMFIPGYNVSPSVIQPATWKTPAANKLRGIYATVKLALFPSSSHFRIYAGQLDANDPSHFTIKYDFEGKSYTVDGWLREQTPGFPMIELKDNR